MRQIPGHRTQLRLQCGVLERLLLTLLLFSLGTRLLNLKVLRRLLLRDHLFAVPLQGLGLLHFAHASKGVAHAYTAAWVAGLRACLHHEIDAELTQRRACYSTDALVKHIDH
ncbi:hypothetical protein D3C81_1654230 [compost metagenome]